MLQLALFMLVNHSTIALPVFRVYGVKMNMGDWYNPRPSFAGEGNQRLMPSRAFRLIKVPGISDTETLTCQCSLK